jgi:hypothetical protein
VIRLAEREHTSIEDLRHGLKFKNQGIAQYKTYKIKKNPQSLIVSQLSLWQNNNNKTAIIKT